MLTLTIDLERWRSHQDRIAQETPGLVPVAKGNGYGFGLPRLAAEAQRLGVPVMAVGTAAEVAQVRPHFSGSVVVLQPWSPQFDYEIDEETIVTVARVSDLAELPDGTRTLVEVMTSMKRFGISRDEFGQVSQHLGHLRFEGWTIHLPMDSGLAEGENLARLARSAVEAPVWFSHLDRHVYDNLAAEFDVRLRSGTELWLGEPAALQVEAQVLDVHPVKRGEKIGYWQRPVPNKGHVLMLSGGTANGIGMAAPTAAHGMGQRARALAGGGLEAVGAALSPYSIAGTKRWFCEPPHMQASMVFLPAKVDPPEIGSWVPVAVRNTTATFDQVIEA